MNFSYTESFRRLIDQIITVHHHIFAFSKSDLEVVRDHASILDIRDFMEKIRRKQTSYADSYLTGMEVVSLVQDLEHVFKVPKLKRPRNVQLANFISFLVQLLIGKQHLFAFDTYLVISTELMSFSTILLDSPFQSTENHSEVQTLLPEFETLANESGRLVYSLLFSPHLPPSVKIEILSKPIILLKDNLIQFSNSPSYINTPNTAHFAMSSIFIVDSFLCDLENLMNGEDYSILEVKDDVLMLHQSLKHFMVFVEQEFR